MFIFLCFQLNAGLEKTVGLRKLTGSEPIWSGVNCLSSNTMTNVELYRKKKRLK